MKKQMTAVAVLALVAGTALAAPRESLPGPASLNVNGNSLPSETFSLNFTGSDGGGAYQATRVAMTGTLTSNQTNTWPNDTSMDVTPPGGAAVTMLVSPTAGAYTSVAVNMNNPIGGSVNPAGSWLFDVYDTIEDGDGTSAEAILTDIVVTLDDAPAQPGSTQADAVNLGTLVDGTNVSTEAVIDPAGLRWYKFVTLDCSAAAGRKLSIGTLNSTMGGDSEFAIWLQDGSAGWTNDDANGTLLSFLSFGVNSTIGVDLPAGEKFVCVGSYNTNFFLNFVVNTTGPGGTFQLDILQEFLGVPTAPDAEDLGTLVDGTMVTRNPSIDPASVKWYKATVAAANAVNGRTLRVTTMNTVDATDTELGVYTQPGALVAAIDDFGGTLLSDLTFGANGVNGDIAAGLHYIAVGTYNTNFLNAWNAQSTGPGGACQLDVIQSVSAPAIVWDEAANGNGDAGNSLETAQVVSGSGPLDRITGSFEGTDFDVFQINICDAGAFSATTQFSANNPDTQLFLFDAAGNPVEFNDDAAGIGYSRIDATFVTGTGNYLLCVSRYDNDPVDAGGNEFWLDAPFAGVRAPDGPGVGNTLAGNNGANTAVGTYRIDLTGVCYSGAGGACSVADVGMAGGEPGQDNLLDNNDFIAFINFFFAQNSIADMGAAGGVAGSDGLYDNNDFIAFINHFFEDAAACNG